METGAAHLVICGIGYTGTAIAKAARAAGFAVSGTARDPTGLRGPEGVAIVGFGAAGPVIATATHLLVTAGPEAESDPVLARYRDAISANSGLRWIGYLSTTGVYGDRGGGWVDEDTQPAPASARTQRRMQAEADWGGYASGCAVDVFRVGGIYGPQRSVFDDLRAGTARRIVKPGHAFGRMHRDDIARAVVTAMSQGPGPGRRIFNLVDDEPAESASVIEAAARLLGVEPPDSVPFALAGESMSPMARSFWGENRRVSSAKTKAMLGIGWLYPSYREGLRAILTEERLQRPA